MKCEVNYAKQFCGLGCGQTTAAASHPLAVCGFSSVFISAVSPPFSPLNKQIGAYLCLSLKKKLASENSDSSAENIANGRKSMRVSKEFSIIINRILLNYLCVAIDNARLIKIKSRIVRAF